MSRPSVEFQGKAIVQRDEEDGLFVMMPDGAIEWASDPKEAYRKVRAWFKKEMNLDAVNVGTIEWRDGIQPPSV